MSLPRQSEVQPMRGQKTRPTCRVQDAAGKMLPLHKLPVNPVVIMLPNLPPRKRSQSQEHVGSVGVVIHIAVRLRLQVREESNCRESVLCILTASIRT